jgi:cell division protein FtsB
MKETLAEIRARLQGGLLPFFGFCALVYFSYHTVQGEHGLIAHARVSDAIAKLEMEVEQTRAERERLEHRVALMAPESIDRDLLDERAREELGLNHRDDIVIYLND